MDVETLAPLTLAQLRLWRQEMERPGDPVLLIPLTRRVRQPVRVDRLLAALRALVARHDALRCGFDTELRNVDTDSATGAPRPEPRQLVGAPASVCRRLRLPCVDLQRLTPAARRRESRRLGLDVSRRPFDLTRPPLLRALLLRLEPAEAFLTLTAHHLVFDNGSSAVFFDELSTLYENPEAELAALPCTYAQIATEQRQHLPAQQIEQQLAAWHRRLDGLDALDLPTDRPRAAPPPSPPHSSARHVSRHLSPGPVRDGSRLDLTLPRATSRAVLEQARQAAVTPFLVLLTGLALSLGQRCGQTRIPIVSSIVRRHEARLTGLVGLFTQPLLIVVDTSPVPAFDQLLRRTQLAFLDALQDEVPADLLWHRRGEPLLRHPLARVGFTQRPAPARPCVQAPPRQLDLEAAELTIQAPRFDLETQVWTEGERIHASAYYDAALFDDTSVEALHEHWWSVLERLCAVPAP